LKLDFATLGQLTFEAPRDGAFPALGLARRAGLAGGTLPAVFNAANEVAVEAFRNRAIPFPGIWRCVERVMDAHETTANPTLDDILEADRQARDLARR